MSAPVIPVPAAQPTGDANAAMEATIKATMDHSAPLYKEGDEGSVEETQSTSQAPADAAPSSGAPQRDPVTGKFVRAGEPSEVVPAPGGPPAAPDGAPAEIPTEEIPVEIPEGFVAAPPLAEAKRTGFKVRDAEGEIVPPDLTWEVNTTAGVRELSTDKLIAYAQMGVYNHEREQRSQVTQQHLTQSQQAAQRFAEQAREWQYKYEGLFSSDDAYLTARAEYERQNTPEMRIDRERQATRAANERVELMQLQQTGTQFFNGTVQPAVETIRNALPTVSDDEISSRLFLLTEHLRVQTSAGPIFPVAAYSQIQQALLNDVVPWAQQLHESRAVEKGRAEAQTSKAKLEVEAARVRAQKARRAASTANRPAGSNQPGNARPIPPTVRTNKDAESAVINGTMAALGR